MCDKGRTESTRPFVNGLKFELTNFPDKAYADGQIIRVEGAKQSRNRSIEWSFGIVGVLLAAAVAAPSHTTLLTLMLCVTAAALAIQLTALSTSDQSACRGLQVIGAHLNYLRFPQLLPKSAELTEQAFWAHTLGIIVQVDLLGARVQTKASLFRDVLLFGPGYLFLSALVLSWSLAYLDLGPLTTANSLDWVLAIALPSLLYLVLGVISFRRTLGKSEAKLDGLKDCPVCSRLNSSKLKPSAEFLKEVDMIESELKREILKPA